MESNPNNVTSILSSLTWHYLFNESADPRSNNLPLMKNPIPICAIVILYLSFVLKWGPQFMKYRRPFQLKGIIMIYNMAQIIMNLFLSLMAGRIWKNYNWICQPLDKSNSDFALMTVSVAHLYFLNKVFDLADTFFFVFRKKQSQITFLHVWHHAFMVLVVWLGVKYWPNGHGSFIGLINTFVHVLLYLYYFLAALGPRVQKYLWWKRYLTILQLVQFGLLFIHSLLIFLPGCNYPKQVAFISIPNVIVFYLLFMDFYKKNYNSKGYKRD